jgi:hypothetical protein
MQYSFSNLIEEFGVPQIIIPNEDGVWYYGTNLPNRKQKKFGETEFLAVKSRIETWVSNENELLDYLRKQDLEAIETQYFYKSESGSGRYTTKDWKESKVAIATNADIQPLNLADLLKHIEEKRILFVYDVRSMGDGYVYFRICEKNFLPSFSGYHFLFNKPLSLIEDKLRNMGDDYEWDKEFFNYHANYFHEFFN